MPRPHKIDELPPADRRAVVKAIAAAMTGEAEPNYRSLLARLNVQVPSFGALDLDHTALWRYAKKKVQPGIAQATREIAARQIEETRAREPNSHDVIEATGSATDLALVADPIKSLLDTQRLRLERVINESTESGQLDTAIRAESVYGANIERTAKAIMHPGFSSAPQATNTTNNIVVVMPGTAQQPALPAPGTGVIEAEVVDIE